MKHTIWHHFAMGVALALIKLHDIALALVHPKRILAMCIFCREEDGKEY